MTNLDTRKKKHLSRRFLLVCLMIFGSLVGLHAQTPEVSWVGNTPALSSTNIVIKGNTENLNLQFAIVGKNLTAGKLKIEYPEGVQVTGVASSSNITMNFAGATVTATAIEIPITTTLAVTASVNLTLKADDCNKPVTGGKVKVSVLENGTPIALFNGSGATSKESGLNVLKPNIGLGSGAIISSPELTDVAEQFTFNLPLTVTNTGAYANSLTVQVVADKFTSISALTLGGTTIAVPEAVVASGSKTYTINLTKSIIGSTPISVSAPKTLTVTAYSVMRGIHTLDVNAIYPETSEGTACSTQNNMTKLTLSYKSATGTAIITNVSNALLTTHPRTGASMPASYNGTSVNYIRYTYKNSGTTGVSQFSTQFQASQASWMGLYKYVSRQVGLDTVYYQIGSGDIKPVPRPYTYATLLGTGNNVIAPYSSEYRYVTTIIDDYIAAGAQISVYYPICRGNIYNNSSAAYVGSGNGDIRYWQSYSVVQTTSLDENNSAVQIGGDINRYTEGNSPCFTITPPAGVVIKPNTSEKGTVSITWGSRIGSAKERAKLNIIMPDWLDVEDITTGDGTSVIDAALTPTNTVSGGTRTYSCLVRTAVNNKSVLIVQYKAQAAGSFPANTKVAAGTMRYTIDWNPNYDGSGNSTYLTELKALTVQTQQVTCPVAEDGITIDTCYLRRDSRGLTIAGATPDAYTRTPLDGSLAPQTGTNPINNNAFWPTDAGKIVLETEVVTGGTYQYLYVLLNSTYMSYFTLSGTPTVQRISNSSTIVVEDAEIVQSGQNTYVRMKYPSNGYFAAEKLYINIPVVAKTTATGSNFEARDLYAQAYLSATKIEDKTSGSKNPLSPDEADRHGFDVAKSSWQITMDGYSEEGRTYVNPAVEGGSNITATINAARDEIYIAYTYANSGGGMQNTTNEYRPAFVWNKMTMILDAGINPKYLVMKRKSHADVSSAIGDTLRFVHTSAVTQSDGRILYTWDLLSRFSLVDNLADAQAAAAATPKQWIYPDDLAAFTFYLKTDPLPTCPPTSVATVAGTTLSSRSGYTKAVAWGTNGIKNINYEGYAGQLSTQKTTETIYSKEITVSGIQAGVSGPAGTIPAWLYIAGGDIQTGSITVNNISGSGAGGRWINLGMVTVNDIRNYTLKYKMNNITAAGDKITVYLVCGYGINIGDPTTGAIGTVTEMYRSVFKEITLTPVTDNAVAQGSIAITGTVLTDGIAYNTEYPVEIEVNSRGSLSDLINAEVEFTLPEGQQLTSVGYTYKGVYVASPATAASVKATFAASKKIRLADVAGKDVILYGSMVDGKIHTDSTTFYLHLGFTPDCETSFHGTTYEISVAGFNILNNAATPALNIFSNTVMTDIKAQYAFMLNVTTQDGNYAFGGESVSNNLKIEVTKNFDPETPNGTPLELTDYVEVTVPRWLTLDGNIVMESSVVEINNQTATLVSEVTSGENKIWQIRLPAAALNSTAHNGMNKAVVFNIPVTYAATTDNNLVNTPEKKIDAKVYTLKRFSEGSSTPLACPLQPFLLGSTSKGVALLTFKNASPYTVCAGAPLSMQVTSAGFVGEWFTDAAMTQSFGSGAIATYAPAIADFPTDDEVSIYVKSDFAVNYGQVVVKVNVKAVPSLVDLASWTETACSAQTRNGVALSTTPGGANINWTAVSSPANAVTGFAASGTGSLPNATLTNATASPATVVYTINPSLNGCTGESQSYTVTVNPVPTVPTVSTPVSYCQGVTASALTATATAGNTLKWYDANDNPLSGAPTPVTTSTGSTTYKVSQRTTSGCESNKAAIVVTINELPAAPAATTAISYCQNAPAVALSATATGTNSLKWYTATDTEITTGAPTPSTSTVGNTIYKVSQKTTSGCESAKTSITVSVTALPAAPVATAAISYCQNDAANPLTATALAGNTLQWYESGGNPLPGAPTPSTTATGTTTYKVSQKNAIGCESAQTTITVTVTTLPALPGVNSPVVYCQGATATALTATATAGNTLKWYDANDNPLSGAPTPATTSTGSTTYKVSQRTTSGCESNKASIVVTINELPTAPAATTAISYCHNAPAVALSATATGTNTLKWYTATDTEITTGAPTPNTTTVGNTIYKVSQKTTSGCESAKTTITVTITALPAAPVAPTAISYCQNAIASPLTATALAGNTLQWYESGGNPLSGAPTPNTTAPGTTTYKVSQKNGSGCESPQTTIIVTINALPTLPGVTSPVTYCQGAAASALTATATAGNTLVWYDANDNQLSNAPTPNTQVSGTTTYKVSQKTSTGCESNKATITVTINELPGAPVAPTTISYCQNEAASTLTATATGTNTLKWYTATDTEITTGAPTPLTTTAGNTIYKVSQKSLSGCESAKTTITVTVHALPAAPVASSPVVYCQNAVSVPLSATALNGNTLRWYDASGTQLNNTPIPATTVAGSTTYKVSQVSSQGCESAQTTITVTVNALPAITIGGISDLCVNGTLTLTNGTTGGSGVWSSSNSSVATITTAGVITANKAGSFQVSYTHTDANGCVNSQTTGSYTVNTLPIPVLTNPVLSVCEQSTGMIYDTPAGMTNYQWTVTGGTKVSDNANEAVIDWGTSGYGTISINYTDANGCTAVSPKTYTVTIKALPNATFNMPNTSVCEGSPITLSAINKTGIWSDNGTTLGSINSNGVFSATTAGTVQITYTVTENGCTASSDQTLTINALPTVSGITNNKTTSSVCPGEDLELTFDLTGQSPWTITYSDGNSTNKVTATSSPYTLSIPGLTATSTYNVVSLTDGNTCFNSSAAVTDATTTIALDSPVTILAQPTNQEYCPGSEGITFTVEAAGTNLAYQWYEYDSANNSWTTVGTDNNTFSYDPEDSNENRFYVTVSGKCSTVDSKTVTSKEKVQVIEQKRNHTLVVNNNALSNGGHNFTYYYWYKNNEPLLEGSSEAGYYYTGGVNLDPQSTYYAVVLDENNQRYTTCEYTPSIKSGIAVQAWPNPVNTISENLTIDVEAGSDIWEGATIEVYNAIGLQVGKHLATGPSTTIKMPTIPGAYVVKFRSSDTIREMKVIVK